MIVYGMNRWKFAQASATADGCGVVGTEDGGSDDPPVGKFVMNEPGCSPPKDGATAAAKPQSLSESSTSESADPPVEKSRRGYPSPRDEATAAMTLSSLMLPKGESDDGAVKKRSSARGSEKMQAVRPDENPGDDASKESRDSRPSRRRKRRTKSPLGRPSSTT